MCGVAASSRKTRSCETTTAIRCCHVGEVESSLASHSTAPAHRGGKGGEGREAHRGGRRLSSRRGESRSTDREVVGRLVEQQQVGPVHSCSCEEAPCAADSSSSKSGLAKIAAARAVRTRHPPESASILLARSSAEKPKLVSKDVARSSAVCA